MPRDRRFLVLRAVMASTRDGFEEDQELQFARCPEAAQFSDEEAEDFFAAVHYLDSLNHKEIVSVLRQGRVTYPPELAFDEYRLSRHILHRWREPAIPEMFHNYGLQLNRRVIERQLRRGDLPSIMASAERYGPLGTLSTLRQHGMPEVGQALREMFSPQQVVRYKALVLFSKRLMYRMITEPEPSRRLSRWEQKQMARRIRLREVQLRSMRQNRYKLRRERKALLSQIREIAGQEDPELKQYAAEFQQLRTTRMQAERKHVAALAEQAARYQAAIAQLQRELAAAQQDYADTLRVRSSWLPILGGDKHGAGLVVRAAHRRGRRSDSVGDSGRVARS